ncbi:hypothetical protein [Longimicrobium sp.]|uniref:hypothetical protein n=1 Tax=Longimicrobium sp. TaxID=2029185 RepID=UPI002D7E4ABD|nr:hypothetical protein [Longimicrobium sp.]
MGAAPARMARAGTTTTASTDFVASGNLDILARFRVKPQITIAWAKAWIGPEGGRVDFQGFTIVVPAGAVDKVTMFTIRLPVDPNGSERVVAEFGPHNVPFAKPVTIGLPVRGTTVEGNTAAHVVWWSDGWVNMGGTVSADGTQILTQTPHFSEYGVTAERGGGMSVSGG